MYYTPVTTLTLAVVTGCRTLAELQIQPATHSEKMSKYRDKR